MERDMTLVIATTEQEHAALLALGLPFEFSIIGSFSPAYTRDLAAECRRRGHPNANWCDPTGTLELWARCVSFEEFMHRNSF